MPIFNEVDEIPETSIWTLPVIIEKKKDYFNGTEEE